MKFPSTSHPQRLRGLTLIELVVVLAILVALVGLVLAFFPGLVARASRSTAASSIQDIARAVQINYPTPLSYGSGYDSLLYSGGAALYSGLTPSASNQLARVTLSANDATALTAIGIGTIYHLSQVTGASPDATFAVTATNSAIGIATATPVAAISSSATSLQQSLRGNYTPTGTPTYVVFGLNRYASIVGGNSILQDAPVRAGTTSSENPTTSYQRYGLVFLIDDSGVGGARNARFLNAVAFTSTGITTAENNLQQYFAN